LHLEPLEDRLCPSGGYLLVDSVNTDSVLRYDETTGAFVDAFVPSRSGGLRTPIGLIFGPDHNLYVTSNYKPGAAAPNQDAVLRYDGSTGDSLGAFTPDMTVTNPRTVLFGPDGNVYVGNEYGDGAVLRFDGTTGAFLGNFVRTGTGGLDDPTGMVFGPDGQNDGKLDLYVGQGSVNSNILRFDGTTGAYKGVFVASFTGGLSRAGQMSFGPDGNLYVVSSNSGTILRFAGPGATNPGTLLGTVASGLYGPAGLLFGPDARGQGNLDLYVTNQVPDGKTVDGEVLRYDWASGAFLGTFVSPGSGGLSNAFLMTFTETDPTTLNYRGTGGDPYGSYAPPAAPAQPATGRQATPASTPPATGTVPAAIAGAAGGVAPSVQPSGTMPAADLVGAMRGLAFGTSSGLDTTAAGWGGVGDRRLGGDSAFPTSGNPGEGGHRDRGTVLLPAIGHRPGRDHAAEGTSLADPFLDGLVLQDLKKQG
jgi:hypothetical protein